MENLKAYFQPRAVTKLIQDMYGRSRVHWPGEATHKVRAAHLLMFPRLNGEDPPVFMRIGENITLDPYPYVGGNEFYFLPWDPGVVTLRRSFTQAFEADARVNVEQGDLVLFARGEAHAYWVSSSVRGFLFFRGTR